MRMLPSLSRKHARLREDSFQNENDERHPDGRRTVVPVHSGETIGPGLLSKILKDAEMEMDEFERSL
jgi:hypothetical protein